MKFIVTALAAVILATACTHSENKALQTVVKTTNGQVRGYMKDSVLIFKGIPYASAKRFERPTAAAKWDTIMDCTEYSDVAPQLDPIPPMAYNPADTVRTMSEDCLNLNIWTSARKDDGGGRPVMVWLHGGGFSFGSSRQNRTLEGSYLADRENVVVVSLNHRLGVLGFLDLSAFGKEYSDSGNHGMLDIVAALWWIRDNIAAFGGDPENITIFGEGSGGVKVLTLMAMPMAKGLFQKAIVQSGVLEGMNQYSEFSRKLGAYTVEEAGVGSPQELRELSFEEIDKACTTAIERIRNEHPKSPLEKIRLAPVSGTKILPKPIYSDSAIYSSSDVPIIIGSNLSDLTGFNKMPDSLTLARENVLKMSEAEIDRRMREKYGDMAETVKREFLLAHPDRTPGEALVVDTYVRSLVLHMAHVLAMRGNAPVYVYLFSWTSPLHDGYALSFRSSEVPFVFGNYQMADFSRAGGDEARRLSRIMTRSWASFARTGNPNNSITPFWRRINLGEGYTMIFDNDVRLEGYNDLPLIRLFHPEAVKDINITNYYQQ